MSITFALDNWTCTIDAQLLPPVAAMMQALSACKPYLDHMGHGAFEDCTEPLKLIGRTMLTLYRFTSVIDPVLVTSELTS